MANVAVMIGDEVIFVVALGVTEGLALGVKVELESRLPEHYQCITPNRLLRRVNVARLCERYKSGQFEHKAICKTLEEGTAQALLEDIRCGVLTVKDLNRIIPCEHFRNKVRKNIVADPDGGESKGFYSALTVPTTHVAEKTVKSVYDSEDTMPEESETPEPAARTTAAPASFLDASIKVILVAIAATAACAFVYAVFFAKPSQGGDGALIAKKDETEEPTKFVRIDADDYATLQLERVGDGLEIEAKSGSGFNAPLGEYLVSALFDDGTFRQYHRTIKDARNRFLAIKKYPQSPFDGQLSIVDGIQYSHPITVAEFESVLSKSRSLAFLRINKKEIGGPNDPVKVIYSDATLFAESVGMRLPSAEELRSIPLDVDITAWSHTFFKSNEHKVKVVISGSGKVPALGLRGFANLVLVRPLDRR